MRSGRAPSDTQELLVFLVDDQCHALHLSQVVRVVRAVEITPLPRSSAPVAGVIDVGGTMVPVFLMRERLGLPDRPLDLADRIVLTMLDGRMVGLVVSTVLGVVERPASDVLPADALSTDTGLVRGLTRLDERILLIHDLDRFLSPREEAALTGIMDR